MRKFFYQVNGTISRTTGNQSNLVEINEIFKDDNPVIGREKASLLLEVDIFL